MGLGYNKCYIKSRTTSCCSYDKKFLNDVTCGQVVLVVNELEIETMQQLLSDAG